LPHTDEFRLAVLFYALSHLSFLHESVFFFFLLIRPPARSTLFPYTTLFRSRRGHLMASLVIAEHDNASLKDATHKTVSGVFQRRDRKSTRLNSSHVKISYAVFCLKKKKNKNNIHTMPTTQPSTSISNIKQIS